MRKKILLSGLVFTFCFLLKVSAQYEGILKPLSNQEIELYKKAGVKLEKQEATGNLALGSAENKIRYLSPEGLLLGQFTYRDRLYLMYDEAGRVVKAMDSLMTKEDHFEVMKYMVSYSPNNKPIQLVINDAWSTFQWNPTTNELTETLSHDTPAINVYKYDGAGRLILSKSFTQSQYLLEKHELNYSKNGLLYNEQLIENNGATKDSIAVYYFYNDDHSIESRQVFQNKTAILGDPKSSSGREATHNEAGISKYIYNAKGQLIKMEFSSSASKIKNFYFSYTYNDKGLKETETRVYNKQEPLVIEYSYVYY